MKARDLEPGDRFQGLLVDNEAEMDDDGPYHAHDIRHVSKEDSVTGHESVLVYNHDLDKVWGFNPDDDVLLLR